MNKPLNWLMKEGKMDKQMNEETKEEIDLRINW